MLKGLLPIFVGFICIFAMGCGKDSPWREAGAAQTIERSLQGFHSIEIGQKFKLLLIQDSTQSPNVVIDYFENLNPNISTTITDSVLSIKDQNTFQWTRDLNILPTVTVNVSSLKNLTISGACEVICVDTIFGKQMTIQYSSVKHSQFRVDCGNLYGSSNNTGSIYFEGRGTIFAWSCEKGAWFDARNLRCDDAYIQHYTKQSLWVYPTKVAEFNIFNTGDIHYKDFGLLKKNFHQYGSGQAIAD